MTEIKRKAGRPNQGRQRRFELKLTEHERRRLDEMAVAAGEKPSDTIRRKVFRE